MDDHEAEDAAFEERLRLRREAAQQRWGSRQGLIRLNDRPQREVFQGLKRSLPSLRDAERLFDHVEARLGDRAVRDVWATSNERCLLLRDPERPDWFLPQRLLYLIVDWAQPEAPFMPMEVPPHIQRLIDRQKAREALEAAASPPPPAAEVVPLSPGGVPGRFCIHEGPANIDITFGQRGAFEMASLTGGDIYSGGSPEVNPYILDPHARPPQVPPLSLLTRDQIGREGVSLEELAELVVALRPEQADRGRVWLPTAQPGTVTGAWARGLNNLKNAEWEGRLPEGTGWVVIDAWNGTASATGPTLEDAAAAWHLRVCEAQPLPPVENAPPPPPPLPLEDDDPPDPSRAANQAPAAEGADVVDLPDPAREGTVVGGGTFHFEFHPPVILAWPPPRPENVPAIAVPLPPTPPVPESLVDAGFTRALRLFGDHGDVGFAFVRAEHRGFTLIGDDAVAALDLPQLEAAIAQVDQRSRDEYVDPFGHGDPWEDPRYPVQVMYYRVWDDLGRSPEFQGGGMAWQAELAPRGWGIGLRHQVMRVRYVRTRT